MGNSFVKGDRAHNQHVVREYFREIKHAYYCLSKTSRVSCFREMKTNDSLSTSSNSLTLSRFPSIRQSFGSSMSNEKTESEKSKLSSTKSSSVCSDGSVLTFQVEIIGLHEYQVAVLNHRRVNTILCNQLLLSGSSSGKELRGVVIDGPVPYNDGIFFVLKDSLSNIVIVGVFNSGAATMKQARRLFPLGVVVSLLNPTLDTALFGTSSKGPVIPFVRVEELGKNIYIINDYETSFAPADVNGDGSSAYSIAPVDAKGWYALGNELCSYQGQAVASPLVLSNSAECFGRGMIMSSRDIVVLLCNRAAAYLNCGLPAYAARDCAAACHLDPENFRSTAPHRLKVALKALNMKMIVDQLDQFDSDKGDADLQEAYSVMQESMWWEDSDDLMEALHNTTGRITVPTLDQKRQQDAEREEKQQLDHDPQHICRLAASFEQDAEREEKRQIVIPHRSGADTTIRYNGHEHAMTPQQLLLDVLPIENKSLDDDVVHSNFSHFRRSISKGNSYRRLENRSRSISPTRTGGAQPGSTIATPAVGYQAAAAPDGSEGRDAMDDMHGHRSSTRDNGTAGRHVLHRQSSRSESPPPVSSRACGQRLGPGHGGGRDGRDRTAQLLPRGVMLPQLHGLLSPRRDDRPSSRQHISSPFHSSMQSPVHSQHKDQTPRWVTLHKKGVEQFDKQHFDGAAEWFTASMSALVEDDVNNTAAGLLCHRSIKYFQAGKIAQSLVDATVACIINPHFPVAWNRRAIALDRLQHTDAALKAVDTGKSITKAQQGADLNSDFVSLQKQIKKHQAQMEQQAALEQEQAQREKEARERERQRAAEVATQRAAAVHDRLSRGMQIVRTVVGIDLAAEEKRDYWIDYS